MDIRSADIAPMMYMQVQELNIPVQFCTARPARHTPSDTMAEQAQTNFQAKLDTAPSYPSSPFILHSGEIPFTTASSLLAAATLAQARDGTSLHGRPQRCCTYTCKQNWVRCKVVCTSLERMLQLIRPNEA